MRPSVSTGSGPSKEMATIVPHRPRHLTGLATADRKEASVPSQRVATSEETPLLSSIDGPARPEHLRCRETWLRPTERTRPVWSRFRFRQPGRGTVGLAANDPRDIRARVAHLDGDAVNTFSGGAPWAISVATRRSAACSSASSIRAASDLSRGSGWS